MAARDAVVSGLADSWTQLTNGAATSDVTIRVLSGQGFIKATATASEPSDTDDSLLLKSGEGWTEATIAEKFPGVSSAQHLYWYGKAKVFISHG